MKQHGHRKGLRPLARRLSVAQLAKRADKIAARREVKEANRLLALAAARRKKGGKA